MAFRTAAICSRYRDYLRSTESEVPRVGAGLAVDLAIGSVFQRGLKLRAMVVAVSGTP